MILGKLSGGDNVAPVFSNAPNDHKTNATRISSYEGFDFYAGHYGYDVYRELSAGHLLFTNFRDPVQRIYSMYRYWRHNVSMEALSGAHPQDIEVVRLAQRLSFSQFIRAGNDDLKLYINNFHFRQIHRSGWELSEISSAAKCAVRRRIRKMPWFYIAEMTEASAFLLRFRFPEVGEMTIPRDNPSGGEVEPIQMEDAEHLIRMNLLDYEIYTYAVTLQTARLKMATCQSGLQTRA